MIKKIFCCSIAALLFIITLFIPVAEGGPVVSAVVIILSGLLLPIFAFKNSWLGRKFHEITDEN
jgi:hypothetical protein